MVGHIRSAVGYIPAAVGQIPVAVGRILEVGHIPAVLAVQLAVGQ